MGWSRRTVHTSSGVPQRGRPRLWAFGYVDLAALFGTSVDVVRKWVERGKLDPCRLQSIVDAYVEKRGSNEENQ